MKGKQLPSLAPSLGSFLNALRRREIERSSTYRTLKKQNKVQEEEGYIYFLHTGLFFNWA